MKQKCGRAAFLESVLIHLNTVIKRLGKISCIFVSVSVVGNLGRVDYITEYEYDLFIRPDTCNPRFRVWFNFTVENVKADQVGDETCPCITYRRCRFGLSFSKLMVISYEISYELTTYIKSSMSIAFD